MKVKKEIRKLNMRVAKLEALLAPRMISNPKGGDKSGETKEA